MLQCLFLIAALAIPLAAQKVAYVYCTSPDSRVPAIVYSGPPIFLPLRTLKCGEKVQVAGRRESWIVIASSDGEHYVPMTALSQQKDRFVPINIPLPPEPRLTDRRTGIAMPRITSNPDAEYTDAALKAGVHGSVIVKLTVGKDGSARDLKVMNGLGYGLDESAMKAVQSWKFEPALKDGIPVDCAIAVELDFPPKRH